MYLKTLAVKKILNRNLPRTCHFESFQEEELLYLCYTKNKLQLCINIQDEF